MIECRNIAKGKGRGELTTDTTEMNKEKTVKNYFVNKFNNVQETDKF